jgi:lactoylglutathione lyase
MSGKTETAGRYRLAHTMMRVKDLERSLDFYTRILGMKVLRQKEYPDGKFTNTFVGYGPEDTHPTIELTYNWGQEEAYDMGNGWGHVALEVPDVYATCEKLAEAGAKITRPPGPMKHGTRVIAFAEDPDGYKVELLEPLD